MVPHLANLDYRCRWLSQSGDPVTWHWATHHGQDDPARFRRRRDARFGIWACGDGTRCQPGPSARGPGAVGNAPVDHGCLSGTVENDSAALRRAPGVAILCWPIPAEGSAAATAY